MTCSELDIRVIVGNPPYSAGQGSANDDAANIEYPYLDERISKTYVSRSSGKGGGVLLMIAILGLFGGHQTELVIAEWSHLLQALDL